MKSRPTVISLFSGSMGLDLGFEKAGFDIRVALDRSKYCINTINLNRPEIPTIQNDIREVTSKEVLEKAGLKQGKVDVIIGGPPCQSFSTAGKRRSLSDERGQAVLEYVRIINEIRPRFFVFENVEGMLSVPLHGRSSKDPLHCKDSSKEDASAFDTILNSFCKTGYKITWAVVNAADYGVPQKRKRIIVLGSRKAKLDIPGPTHANQSSNELAKSKKPWITLKEALRGLKDTRPEFVPFPGWGRYLKTIPQGGCWINLPRRIQKKFMKGAYYASGGRRSFLRRLSWHTPTPTLVTSPVMKKTCLCHPNGKRPLSVREYARLQGFPASWRFAGATRSKYRMIGEAVPVPLAYSIARSLMQKIRPDRRLRKVLPLIMKN